MLDLRLRTVLLALYVALLGLVGQVESGAVRIVGRLVATDQESADGMFSLSTDEGYDIRITVPVTEGYLRDYLAGTVGHRLALSMEPLP